MKTQSRDTSPEAERVQFEVLRRLSPSRRFALTCELSDWVMRLSLGSIRQAHPELDDRDVRLLWMSHLYGRDVAGRVRASLDGRQIVSIPPSILDTLRPVIGLFEELGLRYYVGGSIASSHYGNYRATNDIDLVADIHPQHVQTLVERLQDAYYISEDAVREAITRRSSFNVIRYGTGNKVDVFVLGARPFDQEAFRRMHSEPSTEDQPDVILSWATPEDVILTKLEWYRMGGEVSEQQWKDVQGVLKTQGASLDLGYMQQWAHSLRVADLLERALADAGLDGPPSPPQPGS